MTPEDEATIAAVTHALVGFHVGQRVRIKEEWRTHGTEAGKKAIIVGFIDGKAFLDPVLFSTTPWDTYWLEPC